VVKRMAGAHEELELIRATIEALMLPAERHEVEEWLAELDAIAPSKTASPVAAQVRLRALTMRLGGHPRDLVRHVLLVKRWRWFPSWFELAEELDRHASDRVALLRAVTEAMHRPAQPEGARKVIDWKRATAIRLDVLGR
jgi:hypothetical protein